MLVSELVPYLKWGKIVLFIGSIILTIVSYKFPRLCKYMHLYTMLQLVVRVTSPIDYGQIKSSYIRIILALRLIIYGYNCKTHIPSIVMCLAYTEIIINHYIYADERTIMELFILCF